MIQSLLVILLVVAILMGIRWFKQQPGPARRRIMLRSLAGAGILMLLAMAVTGRMHWLFALIGALLPFVRGLLGIGIQLLPFWLRRKSAPASEGPPPGAQPPKVDLTISEAMETLGLSGNIDQGEITVAMVNAAHRRLIQKVHPDRGGNDYLASRVNLARDRLLDRLEKRSG